MRNTPLICRLAATLALTLAATFAAGAQGTVEADPPLVLGPKIHDIAAVRTRADLEKQPVIPCAPGLTVRLGLEATQGPQGTILLIYCLPERAPNNKVPPEARQPSSFEPLGPVYYKVTRDNIKLDRLRAHDLTKDLVSGFTYYAAPIPLDEPGKLHVEVEAADGTLLARATIAVLEEFAPQWHPWRILDRKVDPPSVKLDNTPAVPRWDGSLPVVLENPRQQQPPANTAETKLGAAAQKPLVQGVPSEPDPRLKLTAEMGELRLRSEVFLENEPDRCFLTRWWINDKPVRMADKNMRELRMVMAIQQKKRELPVTLSWQVEDVIAQIGAKPGDKVAAQVLYCREGWTDAPSKLHIERLEKMLEKMRRIVDFKVEPVLLSNKVEWTVPAPQPTTAPTPSNK